MATISKARSSELPPRAPPTKHTRFCSKTPFTLWITACHADTELLR